MNRVKSIIVMKIRDINDVLIKTKKHIFFNFRVSNTVKNKSTIICFIRHVYIVESFKIKILFDNNILSFDQIVFNVDKKIVIIDNCQDFIIKFNVINMNSSIKRVVRVSVVTKISIKFNVIISFKMRDKNNALSIERDFMFVFKRIDRLKKNDDVLSHIINVVIEIVLINNVSIENVFISKNCHIDTIQKYEEKNCFLVKHKKVFFVCEFRQSQINFS